MKRNSWQVDSHILAPGRSISPPAETPVAASGFMETTGPETSVETSSRPPPNLSPQNLFPASSIQSPVPAKMEEDCRVHVSCTNILDGFQYE